MKSILSISYLKKLTFPCSISPLASCLKHVDFVYLDCFCQHKLVSFVDQYVLKDVYDLLHITKFEVSILY